MTDCIFCKIVSGDVPSSKIYEDDHVLAFLDITQVTPGHTLLIPKQHVADLFEMDSDLASTVFARLPKIARQLKEKLGAKGLNIVNNNGELAGQTVFHSHIHLLPRLEEGDELDIRFTTHEPDFAALGQLAQDLYLED
ncbi:HIT family protein [Streptococcus moroccensis]|uniref:Histidine triad (HIT) family protein n=1 Tax=Streptococcus moroccensis TaxID=1451356 RepID=A0ABT9YT78_9STRE|nr:HIT family protein [Streptococcus moroccensis]MDQ0223097.1 histidine triad (HIT) family protein [Streptococcus moroccensis]